MRLPTLQPHTQDKLKKLEQPGSVKFGNNYYKLMTQTYQTDERLDGKLAALIVDDSEVMPPRLFQAIRKLSLARRPRVPLTQELSIIGHDKLNQLSVIGALRCACQQMPQTSAESMSMCQMVLRFISR